MVIRRGEPARVAIKPTTGARRVKPGRMNRKAKPSVNMFETGLKMWITKIVDRTMSKERIKEQIRNRRFSFDVGGAPWNLSSKINTEQTTDWNLGHKCFHRFLSFCKDCSSLLVASNEISQARFDLSIMRMSCWILAPWIYTWEVSIFDSNNESVSSSDLFKLDKFDP